MKIKYILINLILIFTTNLFAETKETKEVEKMEFVNILQKVVSDSIQQRNKREIELENQIKELKQKTEEEKQKQNEEMFELKKQNEEEIKAVKRELVEEREKVLNMKQGKYEKELYILRKEQELKRIKHKRELEEIEEKKELMEKKLEAQKIERQAKLPELKSEALEEIKEAVSKIERIVVSFEDTNEIVVTGNRFRAYVDSSKLNDIFEKYILKTIKIERIEEIKEIYKGKEDMYNQNKNTSIIERLMRPFKKAKSSGMYTGDTDTITGLELTNKSIINGYKVLIDFNIESLILYRD